jgi:hypothetical protein
MPLGKGALALWSSSYGRRKPEERHLVAWWWRRGSGRGVGERGWEGEKEEMTGIEEEKKGEGGKE